MKRSKIKKETLVLSLTMAANLILPLSVSGQGGGADGFFKGSSDGYENRDGDAGVSGGITNESFNAPLDGGLLITVAAGAGYALRKRRRRKKTRTFLMAMALLLGMTQCRKNVVDFPHFQDDSHISAVVRNDNLITVDKRNRTRHRIDIRFRIPLNHKCDIVGIILKMWKINDIFPALCHPKQQSHSH